MQLHRTFMLIISQNLSNYDIEIPSNAIYRINLAWTNSLNELEELLKKHSDHEIFIDLPINRTKPPNNKYDLDEITPIFHNYQNIKFLAISNIESKNDLEFYIKSLPNSINIVPKIESPDGVRNIGEIVSVIQSPKKIIMLDHDDLYSSMIKKNEPQTNFVKYIDELIKFCQSNNVILLRTIGVLFSDDEKRITQYIK